MNRRKFIPTNTDRVATTLFLSLGLCLLPALGWAHCDGVKHGDGHPHCSDGGEEPPGQCELEFLAQFDDALADGLKSDGEGFYDATGGDGFRLDTNGSQKIERPGDDRHVRIDFNADESPCEVDGILVGEAAIAAGFCDELKGIDMRFERQVQTDLTPLCDYEYDPSVPPPQMRVSMKVNFLGGADGTLGNPDRRGKPPEFESLVLNYGCQAQHLGSEWFDADSRTWVSLREGVNSTMYFLITGQTACLHEQTSSDPLTDSHGNAIMLNMPFALRLYPQ